MADQNQQAPAPVQRPPAQAQAPAQAPAAPRQAPPPQQQDHPVRAGVVRPAAAEAPGELGARAILDAETRRSQEAAAAHEAQFDGITDATRAEMEAGAAALKRHARTPVAAPASEPADKA